MELILAFHPQDPGSLLPGAAVILSVPVQTLAQHPNPLGLQVKVKVHLII